MLFFIHMLHFGAIPYAKKQRKRELLMINVLLSLHIVLKEDLDLVVHLWTNVLKEEGCNNSQTTKP